MLVREVFRLILSQLSRSGNFESHVPSKLCSYVKNKATSDKELKLILQKIAENDSELFKELLILFLLDNEPTTKKAHMELSQEARLMKKYSSIISDSASQDLVKWLRTATLSPTQPLNGTMFEMLSQKSPHEELFYGMMEDIGCLRDYDGNFTVTNEHMGELFNAIIGKPEPTAEIDESLALSLVTSRSIQANDENEIAAKSKKKRRGIAAKKGKNKGARTLPFDAAQNPMQIVI